MIAHCEKLHLCDSCIYTYPDCDAEEIKFGNGKGNDNIIECDIFNQGDRERVICPSDCTSCYNFLWIQ